MLLTGTFLRTLDEKLRFAIPKPLRDALGFPESSVLLVAPGTDHSLALYTLDGFRQMGSQLAGSPTARDVRAFSRLFYAQAQRISVDRQGRLRVPAELAHLAGLQKEIMLLGVRDHLEIWDRQRWESYLNEKQPYYDQIAEAALGANDESWDQPTATAEQAGPEHASHEPRPPAPTRPR